MSHRTVRFSRERLQKKSLDALWGICTGLIADKKLKDLELLYLDAWLKQNNDIHDDPDVLDLICALSDIVNAEELTKDQHDDMMQLLSDTSAIRSSNGHYAGEGELNEILGLIQGIMSDGVLLKSEIVYLRKRLRESSWSNEWPVSELYRRLNEVLADGVIDKDEKEDLTAMLTAMSGDFLSTGDTGPGVMTLGVDINPSIELIDKVYCFTGTFAFGTRKKCQSVCEDRGGVFSRSLTKKVNYLVMGTIATPDWMYGSYGRKLEKALFYRERDDQDIQIITERDWLSAVM